MYDGKALLFMIAETPVHAGSGMSVGYVDLPLQRDVVKEIPIIQSSGVKGSLRDFFEDVDNKDIVEEIFGPEDGSQYSSAISVSDAKLLFFPVKSLYGVFAYITCPMILNDLVRDMKIINPNFSTNLDILAIPDNQALVMDENIISIDNKIVLNDLLFEKGNINNSLKNFLLDLKDKIFPNSDEYKYWKENFIKRLAVVNDAVFRDFTLLGTEIVTRNRINNETGVVDEEEGGLWDEENLPEDSILYTILHASKPYKDSPNFENGEKIIEHMKDKLNEKRFQIGGHKTIGRGFIFVKFLE